MPISLSKKPYSSTTTTPTSIKKNKKLNITITNRWKWINGCDSHISTFCILPDAAAVGVFAGWLGRDWVVTRRSEVAAVERDYYCRVVVAAPADWQRAVAPALREPGPSPPLPCCPMTGVVRNSWGIGEELERTLLVVIVSGCSVLLLVVQWWECVPVWAVPVSVRICCWRSTVLLAVPFGRPLNSANNMH